MPILLLLSILAFGGGLSADQNRGDDDDPKNKGAMFPEGRDYNFGEVKKGTLVKHAFRIVNRSKAQLRLVSLRFGFCPCATASATKWTLQRNEEGKVEVAVDTRRFSGTKTMSLWLTAERGDVTRKFVFCITGISEEQP